jgi:Protein of unknown function (DUF1194)
MPRLVPNRIMLLLLGIAAAIGHVPAARAADHVDVALVIVNDVSGSINDNEFALQKAGYYDAFLNPAVVSAITHGRNHRIAVAYVEFANDYQVTTVLDWAVIKDAASAAAFATAMRDAPRSFRGHTAIGAGIDEAMRNLAKLAIPADRKVIDVCGDGANNSGRDVTAARDNALAKGVTINGLALANESDIPWLQAHTHPPGGLGDYYRRNVAGGEGSFVLEIHDYRSFAIAIRRKLIEEIASAPTTAPARAAVRLAQE